MLQFNCPRCSGSDIVKRGKRKNKGGTKQLYRCNDCRSTFVEPDGFERMRHSPEIVTRSIHMHEDGMSLSKVQNHLWQHDGEKVTIRTISKWAGKYSDFFKKSAIRAKTPHKRKSTL